MESMPSAGVILKFLPENPVRLPLNLKAGGRRLEALTANGRSPAPQPLASVWPAGSSTLQTNRDSSITCKLLDLGTRTWPLKSPRSASVRLAGLFCFSRRRRDFACWSSPECLPENAPDSADFCLARFWFLTWVARICHMLSIGITIKKPTLIRLIPQIHPIQ